jgi:hypothetical protein
VTVFYGLNGNEILFLERKIETLMLEINLISMIYFISVGGEFLKSME